MRYSYLNMRFVVEKVWIKSLMIYQIAFNYVANDKIPKNDPFYDFNCQFLKIITC